MTEYTIRFDESSDRQLLRLDKPVKERILRKIAQLRSKTSARHLKFGVNCFVLEIGQYRVAYKNDEPDKVRWIVFIGNHKEYLKWLGMD